MLEEEVTISSDDVMSENHPNKDWKMLISESGEISNVDMGSYSLLVKI